MDSTEKSKHEESRVGRRQGACHCEERITNISPNKHWLSAEMLAQWAKDQRAQCESDEVERIEEDK
jgi:hypothetical protein